MRQLKTTVGESGDDNNNNNYYYCYCCYTDTILTAAIIITSITVTIYPTRHRRDGTSSHSNSSTDGNYASSRRARHRGDDRCGSDEQSATCFCSFVATLYSPQTRVRSDKQMALLHGCLGKCFAVTWMRDRNEGPSTLA